MLFPATNTLMTPTLLTRAPMVSQPALRATICCLLHPILTLPTDYAHGGTGTHASNPTHGGLGSSSTSGNDMTGPTTGTSGYGAHPGPHSSGLAADSDRGKSLNTQLFLLGLELSSHDLIDRSSGMTGSGMTGSNTTGSGYGSNTAGPHSSSMANKADPRVDSDLGKHSQSQRYGSGLTRIQTDVARMVVHLGTTVPLEAAV